MHIVCTNFECIFPNKIFMIKIIDLGFKMQVIIIKHFNHIIQRIKFLSVLLP